MSLPRLSEEPGPYRPGDLLTVRHGDRTVRAWYMATTRAGKLRVRKERASGKVSQVLTIDSSEVVEKG